MVCVCMCIACIGCGGDGGAFADTIVAPPFVFIPLVKSLLRSDFQIAAQNCWVKGGGAFTGEIRF